jgi:hypothetical protein
LTDSPPVTIIPSVRNLILEPPINTFNFPAWTNKLRVLVLIIILVMPAYAVLMVAYGFSTEATDVGYAPVQPVPYSHALHAGDLGIDCRYCHTTVEETGHAAVPPTQTCMNCHSRKYGVLKESAKLRLVREAYYGSERQPAGLPVPWVRVHDLPDYVYFNHSAHVTRGVGCVSCHGRVDRMEVVYQAEPLSMSWCLDCHRDPRPNLRPLDQVTNMTWTPPAGSDPATYGQVLFEQYGIRDVDYMQSCSTCHR